MVSVYGADHPGIVHRFVTLLADAQVNITDLATRVIGDAADPVYAMVLDVELPADLAVESLQEQVAALATEVGVDAIDAHRRRRRPLTGSVVWPSAPSSVSRTPC